MTNQGRPLWGLCVLALVLGMMGVAVRPAQAAGTGLTGEYYDNGDFTSLKVTRTDATVDFDWGTNAPASGVGADTFSVRWSGQLEPRFSQTYTFYVTADDGARLWVNDRLVAGQTFYSASAPEISGKIALTAGQPCNLVLEMTENSGLAKARLGWSSASQPKEIIPQSRLYPTLAPAEKGSILVEHWTGLAGTNIATLLADTNYPGRPDTREFPTSFECLQRGWADSYGTRVTGYLVPPASGSYVFAVSGDDTVELRLSTDTNPANKQLIASVPAATGFRQYTNFASQVSTSITLAAQQKYYLELLHKEDAGDDHFTAAWRPPGATNFTVIPADALVPAGLHTALPAQSNIFNTLVPGHPRIFASPEKFEWMRRAVASNAIPQVASWWRTLSNSANSILSQPANVYTQDVRDTILGVSRSVLDRVQKLGLAWQVTGDTNFAERAWTELEAAAAFPNWHPAHFLDTAEMTHAFAVGYDWLYDYWTPARRTVIRMAIVTNGLNPSLSIYTNLSSWAASSANNWNLVCNGGMTLGALAIGTENEPLTEYIVARAVTSAGAVMRHYTTDNGGWYEGPGYWDYTTDYNMRLMAGLESALGTDFSLSDTKAVWETDLFAMGMVGPNKLSFNFADAGAGNMRGPQLFWLSRRFNRPLAAWHERTNAAPEVLDVLWYDARGVSPAAAGLSPDFHYRGPSGTTSYAPADAVTLRTSWSDTDASFVGFKSGEIGASHGNLDAGSFVLDALGRRWAHDLGGDDYALPGYFSTPQRWTYYRLRAEGHNTLVINPDANADQNTGAKPPVILFQTEPNAERSAAVADLTSAYDITRVWRGIQLFHQRRWMLVQDEIQAAAGATVWWFMHVQTNAAPQIDPDGSAAMLTQGTDRLWVKILAGGGTLALSNAVPLPTSPNPTGQNANATMRKLAIKLTGVTNTTLAVLMVPLNPGEDPPDPLPSLTALATWGAMDQQAPAAGTTTVKAGPGGFVDLDLYALASDDQTAVSNLLFGADATNGTAILLADGHTVRFTQPSNAIAPLAFTYTATDQYEDPRLLFHYGFDPPLSDIASNVTDDSGHYRDGALDKQGTGAFAYATNVPAALTPASRQALSLAQSGTNAARLSRSLTAAEYNLSDADWTFSTWFRRASTNTADFLLYVGVGDGYGGSGDEFQVYAPVNESTLGLLHYSAAGTQDVNLVSGNPVRLGEWHHAAVVFDRTSSSNGTLRLYLDGAAAGSATNVRLALAQGTPLRIGGHSVPSAYADRWFDGQFDEVALFSAALSTTEIARLASRTVAQFGGLTSTGTVTVRPFTLPDGWVNQDIGSVGLAGDADCVSNVFTVSGSGADIWGTADAFQFASQTREGDGVLTARVLTQDVTDPWAKAGVMIRETLEAGSRHALTAATPSNNISFQRRVTTDAASLSTTGPAATVPCWVRMARNGSNLISYGSADGTNWTQIGSAPMTNLPATVLWGLAVSSHNNAKVSTARFDRVVFNAPPAFPPPAAATVPPGGTLVVTNEATDPDLPPQTLRYSLLSPPAGASIDTNTGIITWLPLASGTFTLTTRVTDDGTPPLSATNSFPVTVNPMGTAERFWDLATAGGLQAGSGAWNLTTTTWSATGAGSNPLLAWPADGGRAVFAGADGSYTITVADAPMVGSLVFSNAGYTIAGSSLHHYSAPLTIRTEADATIQASLAGTGDLVKDGAARLVLGGAGTFAGDVFLNAGTVRISANNALPPGADVTLGSASTAVRLELTNASQAVGALNVVTTNGALTNVVVLGAGRSLTATGAVLIGSATSNVTTRLVVSGTNGALVVTNNGGLFQVGIGAAPANGNTVTADLSALGTLQVHLGSTGTLRVGDTSGSTGGGVSTLLLAMTNSITAGTLAVGESGRASVHVLRFGRDVNVVNADTLNFAIGYRDSVSIAFATNTGTLVVRGAAGGTSRADLNLATGGSTTGTSGSPAFNVSGHYADLRLDTLKIGDQPRAATLSSTFTFDQGLLDVTAVRMALRLGTSTNNTSTLTLGGGTTTIGAGGVLLASNAVGTLAITGGLVTVQADIFKAAGGTGTAVLVLNGSSAVLDMTGHAIGDAAAPVDRLTFAAGTLRHLAELNDGAPLVKSSTGTLTLAGANAYSGATLVSNGTLRLAGTLGGAGGTVTVLTNATLAGSGTVARTTVINAGGQLAPAGIFGIGSSLALSPGARLQFHLGSAADRVDVSGGLTLDGALDVADGGGFTATNYTLFAYAGALTNLGLALGTIPDTNYAYAIDTSITGLVRLVVSIPQIPLLVVEPAALDFGAAPIGSTNSRAFAIHNDGNAPVTGTAVFAAAGPFAVTGGSPFILTPGATGAVTIRFAPVAEGLFTNAIDFTSNGGDTSPRVTGQGAIVPAADFTLAPAMGEAPLPVVFTDVSAGTITNRFWNFGDGATTNTTATNLTHVYAAAGTDTVTLTVSGPLGVSTLVRSNAVRVLTDAVFTWTNALASGNWSDSVNWSPAGVPDQGARVVFATGGATSVVDGVARTINRLTFNRRAPFVVAGADLVFDDTAIAPPRLQQDSPSNLTLLAGLTLSTDLVVASSAKGSLTLAGPVAGAGGLIVNATNTPGTGWNVLVVTVSNRYSGGTIVNTGRVLLSSTAATLGSGPVAVGPAGQLWLNTAATLSNDFTIAGNNSGGDGHGAIRLDGGSTLRGTITLATNANLNVFSGVGTVAAVIQGLYQLTKADTGTLVLLAANAHAGTSLAGGTLRVARDSAVGVSNLAFTASSTLQATTNLTLTQAIQINSGVTASFDPGTNTLTMAGVISGAGALTMNGATNGAASVLRLTGTNAFTGNVAVNQMTLVVASSDALGAGSKTVNIANGTAGKCSVHLDGSAAPLVLGTNFSFLTSNAAGTFYNDAGTNLVQGNFTLTGGGGDTVLISSTGRVTFAGNFAPSTTNRRLNLRGDGDGEIAGAITDGLGTNVLVAVAKDGGSGTWTLSGANSYSGTTSVSTGRLAVAGSIASSGSVTVTGASTLHLAGGVLTMPSVQIASNCFLTGCGTINGLLINHGTVLSDCGEALHLYGAVTNNGTMRLTAGTVLDAAGPFVNNGLLDLITAAGSLPSNLVNNGVVLDSSNVRLTRLTLSGMDLQVQIQSYVGHTYQLQRNNSFDSATWTDVGPPQAGTGGILTFTDPAGASPPQRACRIRVN